jgi:hypothetical protein
VLPYLEDFVSDDLWESKTFFFFSPSLSSSSSLPPLELESVGAKFWLLVIGVFEAGCDEVFGF